MDPQSEIAALRARVERLEKLAGLVPAPAPAAPVQPAAPAPPPLPVKASAPLIVATPAPFAQQSPRQKNASSGEAWLARIGIGLLLVGLLFFLKLSLDRGWITPLLQLLVASLGCGALIVWGEFLGRSRPELGNLAFGGGIAGLIGVIAAGQYIYVLYGGGLSCVLTIAITLACFIQALRRDSPPLCILALAGAVLSPFFLGLQAPAVHALHAVAAAALALGVFFVRGWRGVLATGAIGAWLLLLGAAIGSRASGVQSDAIVSESAVVFFWLAFWLTPVVRVLMRPDAEERPQLTAVWLGAVLPAISGVLFTAIIWSSPDTHTLGAISLGLAIASAALGLALRSRKPLTASAQFLAAAIFGGSAIPLLLDGAICWIVLAVYSAALQAAIRWTPEKPLTLITHLLSLVCFFVAAALCIRMGYEQHWNAADITSICALIAALIAAARLNADDIFKGLYCGLTSAALIGLAFSATVAGRLPEALLPVACAAIALAAWLGLIAGRNAASEASAHIILALVAPYALLKLFTAFGQTPWLNQPTLSMAALLALGLLIGLRTTLPSTRIIYLWCVHLMWLVLLWSQFREVWGGGMVSVSWAFYAVVLMIAGVVKGAASIRIAGIFSLVLLLVRLFTVDLATLDLAIKTVIFIGIGALFFAAGYFLPRFLPRPRDETP